MSKSTFIAAFLLAIGFQFNLIAQDPHYTEFYASPIFTNPAMTGNFSGTYRFCGIVRQQWASVSPEPFRTFTGSLDVNSPFQLKNAGIALMLTADQSGASALSTGIFSLPLSYGIKLGSAKRTTWTVAVKPEIWKQTLDYSKLNFGDQFNGIRYDPNSPTNEAVINTNVTKANFGAGTYLERKISHRKRLGLGYAINNITKPNMLVTGAEFRLPRRHNVHILSSLQLNEEFDLLPSAQATWQGTHSEINTGAALKYHLKEGDEEQSIQAGIWGRWGDAGNVAFGYTDKNLFLGASYDFNLSRLRVASNYFGGWEISLIYTIATVRDKVKRTRLCPDYL